MRSGTSSGPRRHQVLASGTGPAAASCATPCAGAGDGLEAGGQRPGRAREDGQGEVPLLEGDELALEGIGVRVGTSGTRGASSSSRDAARRPGASAAQRPREDPSETPGRAASPMRASSHGPEQHLISSHMVGAATRRRQIPQRGRLQCDDHCRRHPPRPCRTRWRLPASSLRGRRRDPRAGAAVVKVLVDRDLGPRRTSPMSRPTFTLTRSPTPRRRGSATPSTRADLMGEQPYTLEVSSPGRCTR